MKPLRILQVHNRYQQPGGEDQVAAAEAVLLEEHGHEVVRYSKHNDEVSGIPRLTLAARTLWNRQTSRDIRTLLQSEQPDLMHCHNTFPLISPSVYYAARSENVPVIQTLHNYRLLCPNGLLFRDGHVCEECVHRSLAWPAVRHACYRQDRLATSVVASMLCAHRILGTWNRLINTYIATTDFARRKFIDAGFPRERISVKPNFMSPDPGQGSRSDGYAIYVGRVSEEKGIRTMLEAWRVLAGDVRLVIVGDGPLKSDLQRAYAQDRRIEWTGHLPRETALQWLKRAGYAVFPSVCYEGFPMSIVEAFSAGIPVICADAGSAASIVEDGSTGAHFRVGDPVDLARVVKQFSEQAAEVRAMADRARTSYATRYSPETNYGELRDIYNQALSRHVGTVQS